ncbi:tyrosine-type recombinase/integrase [Myxococcota bacterium]|nr:tyrosine-type recombinase/integrase [Myxococcota bacterium]
MITRDPVTPEIRIPMLEAECSALPARLAQLEAENADLRARLASAADDSPADSKPRSSPPRPRRRGGKLKTLPPPRPGGRISDPRRRKLPSGLVRWEISYPSAYGSRTRALFDTRSQADRARAHLVSQSYETRALGKVVRRAMTMEELRDLQLRAAEKNDTKAHDVSRWKAILEYFGPEIDVATIQPGDVLGFREWLGQRTTRTGTPTKPATINRHLALLRAAMNLAKDDHAITENPVRGKHLHREKGRDRIATPEELARMLEAADPELRLAIVLAHETALRLSSIVELVRSRVDLEAREAFVPDTKNGDAITVPLSAVAVEALSTWLAEHDREGLFTVDPEAISKRFVKLCRKLEIGDLRFHDLRHTAATRLARAADARPLGA